MFVKCIKGYPEILEEGQIYEVEKVTKDKDFVLKEVSPPPPYTCFHKERFIPVNPDDINIEDAFEFTLIYDL
jgi:hypothetical protein